MIFNTTSAGKPEQTKTATPSLSQQTISPDSGKVLSGVIINPITAALLTSLDPDFKEANIAEGVDMFGRIGTHKSGTPVAYGNINGTGSDTLSITGLDFAPTRFYAIATTSSGEESSVGYAYAIKNGNSIARKTKGTVLSVTATFSSNGVTIRAYKSYETTKWNLNYEWVIMG